MTEGQYMTKKILTTTGFLLPENESYKVFEDQSSGFDNFMGRNNDYSIKQLSKYFIENKISLSEQADVLYSRYQSEQSYNNFIAMVDFMADVLGRVECLTFMEWQAYNRHMSTMSLMLCRDLITRELNHASKYDNLTRLSRFVTNVTITKEEGLQRFKTMTAGVDPARINWVNSLEPLMENKGSFLSVFRYIFVSNI